MEGKEQRQFPEYRELAPVEHWSASLSLSEIDEDLFKRSVEETVVETGQSFIGFKVLETNEYVRTRYPRRRYGVPSLEECRESMDRLTAKLEVVSKEQRKIDEPRFRVVIGLIEGYGEQNKTHTKKEVVEQLGEDFLVQSGEIYSVSPQDDNQTYTYTEPAVIIEGDLSKLKQVYELANQFQQERFTVENLQEAKSFVVETKFCTSRDIE